MTMTSCIFLAVAIVAITYVLGYRLGNQKGFQEGAEYVKGVYDAHMDMIIKALKEGGVEIDKIDASSGGGSEETT